MSMHLLNQDSTEQINLWRFDVIETIWSQEWRLNAKTLSRHVYVQKHWKHNNVTVKSKTAQSGINNLLLCTRFNSTTRTKQHAGLYKYPNIKKTCALCQQCSCISCTGQRSHFRERVWKGGGGIHLQVCWPGNCKVAPMRRLCFAVFAFFSILLSLIG